jgi:hypothetical protein
MTPLELSTHAELFTDKLKQDQEKELFYSYINAYWQRVERLERFEDIVGKEKQQKKMSEDEMLAKVKELNEMFGGTG